MFLLIGRWVVAGYGGVNHLCHNSISPPSNPPHPPSPFSLSPLFEIERKQER